MFQKLAEALYFVSDKMIAPVFIRIIDLLYAIRKERQYFLGFMIFGIAISLIFKGIKVAFIVAVSPIFFLLISSAAMTLLVFLGLFLAGLGDYCRRLA